MNDGEKAYGILSPLAGRPAPASMLINIEQLEQAHFARKPDPSDPQQLVSFGTSGHRGTANPGRQAGRSQEETLIVTLERCECKWR